MMTYPNQTTVSTRELAWNTTGNSLTDTGGGLLHNGPMTAEEALRLGGLLDWDVRAVELTTTGMPKGGKPGDRVGDDMGITIPNQYGMIRNSASGPMALGVTGERYQIHQNEETVEFVQTVLDEGGANIVAAGYFGLGQRTFVIAKMPEGILIGGQDAHDFYVGIGNSFDGSGKFTVWTTALRLQCTNMLTASMKGAKSRWGVRHTGDLRGKIAQARESLQLSFAWAEEFAVGGDWMLSQPFSAGDFRTMVNRLEPPSDSAHKGWQARQELKRQTLEGLFHEAPTNELGRGTKWGAYNAFTEYFDYFQPVKGADENGRKRATRTLAAEGDTFKQAAWDYLLAA